MRGQVVALIVPDPHQYAAASFDERQLMVLDLKELLVNYLEAERHSR